MSSGYLYFYDTEFHNFLSSEVGAFRHKGGRFKDLTLGDKLQAVGNTAYDFMTYGGLNPIIAKYVGKDYDMSRSISFFLEPIPDDIAKLFDNKHAYWQSGKKLYEYKVELSTWIQRIGHSPNTLFWCPPSFAQRCSDLVCRSTSSRTKRDELSHTPSMRLMASACL